MCDGKWTRFIGLRDILLMDRASFTEDAQVGDRLIAFDNFKKSTFKYHFEAQFNAAMTLVNLRKLERLTGI